MCVKQLKFDMLKINSNMPSLYGLYDLHKRSRGKICPIIDFRRYCSPPNTNDSQFKALFHLSKIQLTLFHHANVNAALQTAGLAVASVVFCDGAASIKWTSERGFTLHAAPVGTNSK